MVVVRHRRAWHERVSSDESSNLNGFIACIENCIVGFSLWCSQMPMSGKSATFVLKTSHVGICHKFLSSMLVRSWDSFNITKSAVVLHQCIQTILESFTSTSLVFLPSSSSSSSCEASLSSLSCAKLCNVYHILMDQIRIWEHGSAQKWQRSTFTTTTTTTSSSSSSSNNHNHNHSNSNSNSNSNSDTATTTTTTTTTNNNNNNNNNNRKERKQRQQWQEEEEEDSTNEKASRGPAGIFGQQGLLPPINQHGYHVHSLDAECFRCSFCPRVLWASFSCILHVRLPEGTLWRSTWHQFGNYDCAFCYSLRTCHFGESGINARTFHGTMQWRVEELVANTSAAPLAPRCGVPEHQCSPCISNQPGHKVVIVQHAVLCQSWHRISTFSTAQIIYWSMERRWKGFTVLSLSLWI